MVKNLEDSRRTDALVREALRQRGRLRGICLCTVGARDVAATLRAAGRSDIVLIVHELTEGRRDLLTAGAIDAVIDQNPRRRCAVPSTFWPKRSGAASIPRRRCCR